MANKFLFDTRAATLPQTDTTNEADWDVSPNNTIMCDWVVLGTAEVCRVLSNSGLTVSRICNAPGCGGLTVKVGCASVVPLVWVLCLTDQA